METCRELLIIIDIRFIKYNVFYLLFYCKPIIKEMTKTGINNNTTNNVNNNSHNKTFNLQVFLNETCKNAMNITDFVDSIKLQLSDLIKVGEIGYVEGISNIITSNLQSLDISERPIHCTDKKREIVYIKDEDKWEKDNDNDKLRKAIKKIAYKNEKLLPEFKKNIQAVISVNQNILINIVNLLLKLWVVPAIMIKKKKIKLLKIYQKLLHLIKKN